MTPDEIAAKYYGTVPDLGANAFGAPPPPSAAPPPTAVSYYGVAPTPPIDFMKQAGVTLGQTAAEPPPPPPVGPKASPATLGVLQALGQNKLAGALGAPPPPVTTMPEVTVAGVPSAAAPGAPKGAPPPVTTMPEVTVAGSPHAAGPSAPRGPSAIDRAEAELRGTYDEDRRGLQAAADADKSKATLLSAGAAQMARTKMDDQANQEFEAAHHAEVVTKYQDETQRQIDDVRNQTIQPNRAYADSGSAVTAVIGGMLGGIYQGLNHLQSNPFIDQMNKVIDRDIAVQEQAINTKKGAIQDRKGLLAEMRQTYKDQDLAKQQARNLYYEGAKEQLAAEASQYDSPAIQARANQGIALIDREQAKLDLNKAINEAAQRSAAAAAGERQRQKDFDNRIALQKLQNETLLAGGTVSKDLAAADKDRAEATPGPDGLDKAGRSALALERAKAQQELNGITKSIFDTSPGDLAAGGSLGNQAAEHLPGWAPGVAGATKDANVRNAYNARVLSATGAAWKLRTGGVEPKNPTILEEQARPFLVQPSDTAEIIRDKQAALKQHIEGAAAAVGATPAPRVGPQTFDLNGKPIP